MSTLRQKIENCEKLCGTLVSLTDPCLCEIMGNAGFDFIWIDTEHTYMSYKEVLCHLNAARSSGAAAVVRVPQNDLTFTKKILEMDVDGIIFPMVRTAEEAEELMNMTLYPPLGTRGFGPMRAIRYGADDAAEYTEKRSRDLCRFIQIEHIECVENLEEIVKKPYIDGFIFGPNDLSLSLGGIGEKTKSETEAAIRNAVAVLKKHGKYIGISVGHNEDVVKYWSQFPVDLFVSGSDWTFVYSEAERTRRLLESYHILKGAKDDE